MSRSSDGIRSLQCPAIVGEGLTVAVAVLVGDGIWVEVGMGVGVEGGGSGLNAGIDSGVGNVSALITVLAGSGKTEGSAETMAVVSIS